MAPRMVEFKGDNLVLITDRYKTNNRPAIILQNMDDGATQYVATMNIPEASIEADQVIIKDYTENEGMLAMLMAYGIVSAPLRTIRTGFVDAPVCRLMV